MAIGDICNKCLGSKQYSRGPMNQFGDIWTMPCTQCGCTGYEISKEDREAFYKKEEEAGIRTEKLLKKIHAGYMGDR